MSDNIEVLLVGAGSMAKEYCKVLTAQKYTPIVVGRGEDRAAAFEKQTGIVVQRGGIEKYLRKRDKIPQFAIVAVSVNQLASVTKLLLQKGVKHLLVEKPAALCRKDLEEVCELNRKHEANTYVAYNRRFYSSVQKALEIIEQDGGVTSFFFEFTEWSHIIRNTNHPIEVKENWFLANSTHVADLAFFLGGFPKEMKSYIAGNLDWHSRASAYAGAGISEKGALFAYQANWAAPGRWSVEVMTNKHRLHFKPMEKLQIQELNSVAVCPVEIDDRLDLEFKPGLYRQVESFMQMKEDGKKLTVEKQLEHIRYYEQIEVVNEEN